MPEGLQLASSGRIFVRRGLTRAFLSRQSELLVAHSRSLSTLLLDGARGFLHGLVFRWLSALERGACLVIPSLVHIQEVSTGVRQSS